jgi:hypothetical protein
VKRPAFQFYPADWRKDVALQSCSLAAQGLWINALCIAHECEPYGHLTINATPMTVAQLGRQVGAGAKEVQALVDELLAAGVASKTEGGTLYSRRMVRDEDLRNLRAEGGKGGSEHGVKGAEHGAKGGRPRKGKGGFEGGLETPLAPDEKPPPSSSSSSSTADPSLRSGSSTGVPHAASRTIPDVPTSWAEWASWWRFERGVEVDPSSPGDRKRFLPMAERWVSARVSGEQMRRALARAEAEAREPIAYLPAYVDRVLANSQAPPRATALDAQADVLHRITGGFHGRAATDPRTIDVDSQPEAPRIAAGSR